MCRHAKLDEPLLLRKQACKRVREMYGDVVVYKIFKNISVALQYGRLLFLRIPLVTLYVRINADHTRLY